MAGNKNGNGNGDFNVYNYLEGCAKVDPGKRHEYIRLGELWSDFLKGSELEIPGSDYTELDVFDERLEKVAKEIDVQPEVYLILREKAAAHYAQKLAKEAELQKPKSLEETIRLEFDKNGLPHKIVTVGSTADAWSYVLEPYQSLYKLCKGENKVNEFLELCETAKSLASKLNQKEGIVDMFGKLTAQGACDLFKYILDKNLMDQHIEQQIEDCPAQENFAYEEAARKLFGELRAKLDSCTKQDAISKHYVTCEEATRLLTDAEQIMNGYVARKQQQELVLVLETNDDKK